MKKIIAQIKIIYAEDIIKVLSLFFLLVVVFLAVYMNLDRVITQDDPFFHIRFAEIFREEGLRAFTDFNWLYFSDISQDQKYFIYYNFLFYVALIPFTLISPLLLGIKLYGIFFAALEFSLFYLFLSKIGEKRAFFWTVFALAFMDYGSLMRFLLARPFTLAPVLLLLFLYFAYRKKYLAIFFLTVFYFYWHTATFFFPLIVVGAYFAFENFYGRKLDWKMIGAVSGGIVLSFGASLLFAPGLFAYMREIIFGVFQETIIGKKVALSEGSELYARNAVNFIKNNTLILIAFVPAVVFEIKAYVNLKKGCADEQLGEIDISKKSLKSALFLLSLIFLLGTFISGRNADFFAFISLAYVAISANYFLDKVRIENETVKKSIVSGATLLLAIFFCTNSLFIYEHIASTAHYSRIEGASNWIKGNVPPKEIIFNSTWNWFPVLFYYDPGHYYVAGIEPRFFYNYDPEMYWLWWNISNSGFVCREEKCPEMEFFQKRALANEERKKKWLTGQGDEIAKIIKSRFNSRYIISSKSFARLNEVMDNNANFEKVFTDSVYNDFFVYRIK